MKFTHLLATISLAAWFSAPAQAQPAAATTRTYALVAAIGSQFNVVSESANTGSRLSQYKRSTVTAPDNILNMLALQSLDKSVQAIDPKAARTYLMLPPPLEGRYADSRRDDEVTKILQDQLAKLPDRANWYRIMVATPAMRPLEHDGMASNLEGFGVFAQPILGGSYDLGNGEVDFSKQGKVEVITPEERLVQSKTFMAPFSYIAVWIFDAKDLTLLEKQVRYDHEKLADPLAGVLDLTQSLSKEFFARHMLGVIDDSVRKAVTQADRNIKRGEVEIGKVKEVQPWEKPKQ